jgi:hypothetical protein
MKIIPDSNYEKIYTGSSIKASYLKTLLEDAGIAPILRNDGESATAGGFGMDYTNGVKILVHKEKLLTAKHIVQSALDDHGDVIAISEEELEKQALATNEKILKPASQTQQYKRSPFNLLINVVLIVYSFWRLSPILEGEELHPIRIALSGGIILFCSYALIKHFRQ